MRRQTLAVVLLTFLVAAPAAAGWTWPVDGPVLRPFSLSNPYASGQHRGLDVGAALGSPVRAPAAGVVTFAGSVPGGGRAVTITTADAYAVTLLQLGAVTVARDDVVAEGAVVGEVGASEDAVTSAPHVHLGVRVAAEAQGYLDPLSLLPVRVPVAAPPPPPVEPAPAPAPAPERAPSPEPAAEARQREREGAGARADRGSPPPRRRRERRGGRAGPTSRRPRSRRPRRRPRPRRRHRRASRRPCPAAAA
jgi:hypothetical protein